MKKKFQLFLVLLLTYAFICCPVFAGSSFAGSSTANNSSTTPWKARIDAVKSTVALIVDSMPEWIQEFKIPTSSEAIQDNRELRKTIVQQIVTSLGFKKNK